MANTYLTRTPSSGGTPTTQKFTLSFWIKKSAVGINQRWFGVYTSNNLNTNMKFNSNDTLQIYNRNTSTGDKYFVTNRRFRDTNAWYHFVIAIDTTLSTEADRVKFYVNGVEETSFSENYEPPQNYEYRLGEAIETRIGIMDSSSDYLNGCLSHFHYIDGTQYSASDFGSIDSTTGEWRINTSPSVTYGTNGYFILKDGNSVTDQSGNSNNFSVGGGTLTKTEDNPSNVFATLNPLYKTQGTETYASGNNTYKSNSNQFGTAISTIAPNSGKWYFEVQSTFDDGTKGFMGFMDIDNSFLTSAHKYLGMSGTGNCGVGYYGGGNIVANGNQNIHTGLHDWDNGDVIGCALDIDNNKAYFHVNGTYLTLNGYVQNPSSGQYGIDTSSSLYGGAVGFGVSSKDNFNIYVNFGNGSFHSTQLTGTTYQDSNDQGIFKYQPPTNFLALCTKNLNV